MRLCVNGLLQVAVVVGVIQGLVALATPANAQEDSRDPYDRYEISFHFGGLFMEQFGNPGLTCSAQSPRGCDVISPGLGHRDTPPGVFPGTIRGLMPIFLTTGGVVPGNGLLMGLRVGLDLTPRWQLEFTYNYARAEVSLANVQLIPQMVASFQPRNDRVITVLDPSKPAGNQQMYQFNLNRHFVETGRVIPYVGGGFGWIKWSNGPNAIIFTRTDPLLLAQSDVLFSKTSDDDTAIAFNFAGGVKLHATRGFGVRIELMDVVGFPRFHHQFRTVDVSGVIAPVGSTVDLSGTLRQKSAWNHLLFTVGIFWRR